MKTKTVKSTSCKSYGFWTQYGIYTRTEDNENNNDMPLYQNQNHFRDLCKKTICTRHVSFVAPRNVFTFLHVRLNVPVHNKPHSILLSILNYRRQWRFYWGGVQGVWTLPRTRIMPWLFIGSGRSSFD